jgi:large conductance mechanosensitive channel
MGIMSEFREFAVKGNVIDLAVGVIIGGAFGKIVTALVDKVIMPPIGLMIGGVDFSKWVITLQAASVDAEGNEIPAVAIGIGEFFNAGIQFVILAFAIFLMVKAINRLRREETAAPAAPSEPSEEVLLLRDIRDSLQK